MPVQHGHAAGRQRDVDAAPGTGRPEEGGLRAVVGARDLDAFLTDKDTIARDVEEQIRRRPLTRR